MAYDTVYSHSPRATPDFIERLKALVPGGLSVSEAERIIYARDYWPISLRWYLEGKVPSLPDCIVWPETTQQVKAVIDLANGERVPVVPYGEGSGVVGGAVPIRGGVVVDMRKMNAVVDIDDAGLMVRVQAGINGMNLERYLNRAGYTLGHIPQSLYCSSLGGWMACRAAGQFSTKYGKIEDMVVALEAVLADGTVIDSKPVPRSSTGPQVERLLLGSEGTLGIITEATLKIWPYPEKRALASFTFDTLDQPLEAVRRILRKNLYPAVVRIYDQHETLRHFGLKGQCMLILLMQGDADLVELEREAAGRLCVQEGGEERGEEPVKHWLDTRFNVRESSEFTPRGFIFDTVEISVGWRRALETYRAVIEGMRSVDGVVVASGHASHFYPQGVCFYFTFGGIPPKKGSPFAFYEAVWDAIMQATVDHGGSISHHHGIGLIRDKWLPREMGDRLALLQAVKRAVDPHHIMNPGKMEGGHER
ncbi:MAG: FAD-binding oxidoreductase [Candidatus Thermoplasmatota archaeon]|nr:FAD-binding oxidoreductase [Candidatus Thermoplasmatota archaeon]